MNVEVLSKHGGSSVEMACSHARGVLSNAPPVNMTFTIGGPLVLACSP